MGIKFIAVVAVLFVAEISSANEKKEIDVKRRNEVVNLFRKQIESLTKVYHGVEGSDRYSCIPNKDPKCDCLTVSFKAVGDAYTECTVQLIEGIDKFDGSCQSDAFKDLRSTFVTFKETFAHYVVNITFHLTNNECSAALTDLQSAVVFVEDTQKTVNETVHSDGLNEKVIWEIFDIFNTKCKSQIETTQNNFVLQVEDCAKLNPKGKEKTSKVK